MNELWTAVFGFDGLYEVSSIGRIRSLDKWISYKNRSSAFMPGKILTPGFGASMYMSVILTKEGSSKRFYVHHLVLNSFTGEKPTGMEACHNDGDRQNNCVENLRWDTRISNINDKDIHGTSPVGERHPGAKLSNALVVSLRNRRLEGASITELANEFSVSRMTASRAASHKSWSHI